MKRALAIGLLWLAAACSNQPVNYDGAMDMAQ